MFQLKSFQTWVISSLGQAVHPLKSTFDGFMLHLGSLHGWLPTFGKTFAMRGYWTTLVREVFGQYIFYGLFTFSNATTKRKQMEQQSDVMKRLSESGLGFMLSVSPNAKPNMWVSFLLTDYGSSVPPKQLWSSFQWLVCSQYSSLFLSTTMTDPMGESLSWRQQVQSMQRDCRWNWLSDWWPISQKEGLVHSEVQWTWPTIWACLFTLQWRYCFDGWTICPSKQSRHSNISIPTEAYAFAGWAGDLW